MKKFCPPPPSFWSDTKSFGKPQYVNQFLVRHKTFGPAQNIFGPVEGQGKSMSLNDSNFNRCQPRLLYWPKSPHRLGLNKKFNKRWFSFKHEDYLTIFINFVALGDSSKLPPSHELSVKLSMGVSLKSSLFKLSSTYKYLFETWKRRSLLWLILITNSDLLNSWFVLCAIQVLLLRFKMENEKPPPKRIKLDCWHNFLDRSPPKFNWTNQGNLLKGALTTKYLGLARFVVQVL